MPSYSSLESDDDRRTPIGKPFGRQRPIYDILGRGKVADVLLWRDKRVSAGILVGVSIIWLLFEVVEYHFVTCHIIITTILVIFIWCTTADIFKWPPPTIPKSYLTRHLVQRNRCNLARKVNSCRSSLKLHVEMISKSSFWQLLLSGYCQ